MAIRALQDEIGRIVADIPKPPKPKCGKYIQDAVDSQLNKLPNFSTRKEDSDRFLQAQMPVWRTKRDDHEVERTAKRRKIDIVVYEREKPAALIEIESDLNDLRLSGITNRASGKNYDVFSIAKQANGEHFHSYHSLERMAAAAFYYDLRKRYQSLTEFDFAKFSLDRLSAVCSDAIDDHNPTRLPMFLIVGSYRNMDHDILKPRLDSLGAKLLRLR
jgi:hypothetical protein